MINAKWILTLVLFVLCSCQQKSQSKRPKNILLICIDDLRPELNYFGASYIHSPNIDRLASMGRPFLRHYTNSPSCGPSRYTLLTGRYGIQYRSHGNQQLFKRAQEMKVDPKSVSLSMPGWFRKHGYTTISVGKVSHHPGGRGGENWDNDSIPEMPGAWNRHLMPSGIWQHPKGAMHGLAFGQMRTADHRNVFEAVEGPDSSYPDGLIMEEGLQQLDHLTKSNTPFFLAVGLIKPHLPFGVPNKYLKLYNDSIIPPIQHPKKPKGTTTWHNSGEFMQYERWGKDPRENMDFAIELKKYYAACVSYADKHVGDLIDKLKETGADKNTIVVLWGDHGWHLGEHAIWGKHSLFEESLRSPLIIYDPTLDLKGDRSYGMVETLDVFPTLCDLSNLPKPDFLHGTSLLPILESAESAGHPAIAYNAGAVTIRTSTHRLIQHNNGAVELYDHSSPEKETRNIAPENEALVRKLKILLKDELSEIVNVW